MTEAFIDDNIWEINQFPRSGIFNNYFSISNIFYYNSLNDKTFEKVNSVAAIQIPEKLIKGLDINLNNNKKTILYGYKSVKDFVLKNKDIIIKNKCTIMKKEIIGTEEMWSVDLNMLFFNENTDWKK
jgi:hypothetical protein